MKKEVTETAWNFGVNVTSVCLVALMILISPSQFAHSATKKIMQLDGDNAGNGVEIRKYFVSATETKTKYDQSFYFVVVIFNKKQFSAKTIPSPLDIGGITLQGIAKEKTATGKLTAAFSGSYLESFRPATPSGLVRIENKDRNKIKSVEKDVVLNGLMCFKKSILSILKYGDHSSYESFPYCIQNGPLLLFKKPYEFDGENIDQKLNSDFSEGMKRRVFSGISSDGHYVFGATTVTTLPHLKNALSNKNGLPMKSVIMMTGQSGAGIVVYKGKDLHYAFGDTNSPLPNIILVQTSIELNSPTP